LQRRLLHQGDDVVPIPGTRDIGHLASNVAAAEVRLDTKTLTLIEDAAPAGLAVGAPLLG
jgi:aryl-alcohol dehydrogenase-like predicted oxidoreductase